jgi:phage gpG-like protein
MIELTIVTAADQYFHQVGRKIEESVERAMLRIVIQLQSDIRRNKLQGDPLHQRTGNLSREITTNDPRSDGGDILGIVGVARTAPYGEVHEMGGTFTIPEHMSTSRLGNRFSVRAHEATFPARSFLRSTLREQESGIREAIAKAVAQALAT